MHCIVATWKFLSTLSLSSSHSIFTDFIEILYCFQFFLNKNSLAQLLGNVFKEQHVRVVQFFFIEKFLLLILWGAKSDLPHFVQELLACIAAVCKGLGWENKRKIACNDPIVLALQAVSLFSPTPSFPPPKTAATHAMELLPNPVIITPTPLTLLLQVHAIVLDTTYTSVSLVNHIILQVWILKHAI